MNINEAWDDLEDFFQTRAKMTGSVITISKSRFITLSVGFLRNAKDQITGNTHAILAYSRIKNAIVFKFVSDEKLPGAIKISIRDTNVNSSNATLAVRGFLTFYKIDVERYAGRYIAKLEDIPGRGASWVLYLNEGLPKREVSSSKIDILQPLEL